MKSLKKTLKEKIKKLWSDLLRNLYLKAEGQDPQKELEDRKSFVRKFLHDILPQLEPGIFDSYSIIEDGKYNFFLLSTNEFPVIDFYLPATNLCFLIGGLESAPFDETISKRISKKDWEMKRAVLDEKISLIKVVVSADSQPLVPILIAWNDPLNAFDLRERVKRSLTKD